MSTDFVDVASYPEVATEGTQLLGGADLITEKTKRLGGADVVIHSKFDASAATPGAVEQDVIYMHAADWRPPDEGRFEVDSISASHNLILRVRKFHEALSSLTRGTISIKFFDVAMKDTLDEIFNARARSEESWVIEEGRFERSAPPSGAWRTFEELARWIGIGKVRTAKVLGISRGTTNAWKAGGEPQPANARRLYRTHTIVKTLVRRLGLEGTRTWLETGDPAPLDLLSAGDFSAFDRAAASLVFVGGEQESERVAAYTPEPEAPSTAIESSSDDAMAPRRMRRRAPTRRRQQ